jgi:2'-5' RNA ligase
MPKNYYSELREVRSPHNPEEIRSFIAIELPDEVKSGLARLRSELERAEHTYVKWVEPEGIHLTLKFLGNILVTQVTEISKAIGGAAQGISPFHLEISGLGAFPSLKQPHVLWVGIGGEIDKLSRLQQNIDVSLTPFGFAKEERSFVPHLTLARIRQGASPAEGKVFGELAMSVNFEAKYPLDVEAVSLMRSQLTPRGAVYTCLSRVKLETS